MGIADNLKFDMARFAKVLFHINRGIAKVLQCFLAGHGKGFGKVFVALDHFHAAAAAAARCLDQNRIADFLGAFLGFGNGGDFPVRPRNNRNAQFCCGQFGGDLVTHHADMFRRRTDKGKAVFFDHGGKVGIFRQEAVTRMDGFRPGDFGRRQDRRNIQIAVFRCGRADADGFVCQADMHGIGIGGGMHRDSFDAHFAAGALNTQRDFATVGNQ